jgi:hypothetical protein
MIGAVASSSLKELGRRRVALLLVVLLPVAFYLIRIDSPGQAVRFLSLGVGWAIATLALFSHVGSRELDRRLAVIGASPSRLFVGRQIALLGTGCAMAGGYFLLVAITSDVSRLWAVGLLLLTTVIIAVPLGAMISLILPRELEGALALLSIMAMQLLADPEGPIAPLLPLWSTRELGTYAIDPVGLEYLHGGLVHFGVTTAVCVMGGWVATVIRLRPRRLATPAESPEPG